MVCQLIWETMQILIGGGGNKMVVTLHMHGRNRATVKTTKKGATYK